MAGPRLLPPGLLVLLLMPLLPVPVLVLVPPLPLPPGNAAPSPCRPDEFRCAPGAPCFPRDWRCDGHPDCDDDGDEWGCGTATAAEPSPGGPAVTPPRSSAVPPTGSAEASATPEPEVSVPSRSQGYTWILIAAGSLLISGCWLMVLSSRAQSQCLDQGSEWVSACAFSSLGLLSILVAAGSVAVWGLSKVKHRSDIFSLEKAAREQLMPDQSQKGSSP